jgi:crotonobetainyl-CoA:carnitine CoA-transferase CaiB-like acyl-CoA transferase
MASPLKKVRILDFTHLLPGELCSTILADLGCEIIRVESMKPGLGQSLPPIVKGESLYYWSIHRHKRRLRLDLKAPEGLAVAQNLSRQVDIVLENFRPGVMTRLGLGFKQLKKLNNRLIYCSISGYGQGSTWSQRPGHDLNFVAESGILNYNRQPDGTPVLPGALISDYLSAVYAALGVTSALHERNASGKGKHVDISMFECALSTMNVLSTAMLYTGQPPESGNYTYQTELPNYNIYECSDRRYIAVAALEPQFWQIFCQTVGRPELVKTYTGGANAKLRDELAAIFAKRPLAEWQALFDGTNCCVSPVQTLAEALDSLPARERFVLANLMHPTLGLIPQLATPITTRTAKNGAGADKKNVEPSSGQSHGPIEILKSAGYSRRQCERLIKAGVLSQS